MERTAAQAKPFVGEMTYANTCPQNYKFMGKERDPITESGFDDFGARYYASQFQRFVSADWSSIPAPIPYANLTNPQTLNLYAIVRDNPETFADLDGHITGLDCPASSGAGNCQQSSVDTENQQIASAQTARNNAAAQYQLSEKGLDFIKNHESFRGKVYLDSAGNPTIGYGHKIGPGEKFANGVTKKQALALLKQDVQGAVAAVNRYATAMLSQNQVDALVSFTFNVGATGFANSTLRAKIVEGETVREHDFTEYHYSGGRPGLLLLLTCLGATTSVPRAASNSQLPASVCGHWIVKRVLRTTNVQTSSSSLRKLVGLKAVYLPSEMRFGKEAISQPVYVVSELSDAEFFRQNTIPLTQLGIREKSVVVVQVQDSSGKDVVRPGTELFVRSQNEIITTWGGGYFELVRMGTGCKR